MAGWRGELPFGEHEPLAERAPPSSRPQGPAVTPHQYRSWVLKFCMGVCGGRPGKAAPRARVQDRAWALGTIRDMEGTERESPALTKVRLGG